MVRDIIRNLQKDIRVELRSPFALNVSSAFAVIITVSISLASGGIPFTITVQSMLLWTIIVFAAMNGLSHIFVRETEQGTALFLRVSTGADSIFLSKLIYNQVFMALIITIVTPLFLFFLGMSPRHIGHFIAVLFAGGTAIASTTTIVAAMVAKAGGRGSLFTILSFPLMLPILRVAIISTAAALDTGTPSPGGAVFLLAFSGFISVISFLLFRFIWSDE